MIAISIFRPLKRAVGNHWSVKFGDCLYIIAYIHTYRYRMGGLRRLKISESENNMQITVH